MLSVDVLTLSSLYDLARQPYACDAFSPLSGAPCAVVDARAQPTPSQRERDLVAAWITRQACPVIAIAGPDADEPLLRAFDAIARDEADAQWLLAGVLRAPLAAMTLVQVLRATAAMPAAQALLVESLAYSTLQAGPEFQRWLRDHSPRAPQHTDDGDAVLIERDGAHLQLRLNRPQRRNAISVEMRDRLVEALQLVVADASIEAVTIGGNGACFSIGGDLDEFGSSPDPATAHAVRSQRLPAALLVQCAERIHFHVHSACIGAGVEIPAFGHRVSASRNAFFQLPELRFGLIPGAGGCVSLPRRIGRQRTAYLALSMKKINAATALAWGLVDKLTD